MTQHTPGPWHPFQYSPLHAGEDGMFAVRAASQPLNSAVAVIGRPDMYPEAEANAHLIAASPDLLAACRALHDALSDMLEGENTGPGGNAVEANRAAGLAAIDLSFAAIAKAVGQ